MQTGSPATRKGTLGCYNQVPLERVQTRSATGQPLSSAQFGARLPAAADCSADVLFLY
jgi:hypothetical protein